MSSIEVKALNFVCILIALFFLGMVVISVISSGDFLSIDNLFIITVSLLMALLFAVVPLLYLKSENRLPIPFVKRSIPAAAAAAAGGGGGGGADWGQIKSNTPPLLDAKGRAVPPDVKGMVARFGQPEVKDAS
jgi:hypothetical protein